LGASPPQLFGRGGDRPYRSHGVGAYAENLQQFVRLEINASDHASLFVGWLVRSFVKLVCDLSKSRPTSPLVISDVNKARILKAKAN